MASHLQRLPHGECGALGQSPKVWTQRYSWPIELREHRAINSRDHTQKVIIVSSRGGVYSAGPMAAMDFQEDNLRSVLGFIGLTDVSFVRAEGVAIGEDAAKAAVQSAETQLAQTVGALA
jgi:hypothetical protein